MTFSDTAMMELGIMQSTDIHNTRSLIRALRYVLDILHTEEAFTVEEYKHTHKHTHTHTHTRSCMLNIKTKFIKLLFLDYIVEFFRSVQIDMYFLPKEDLDSCPVAGRLANNVKLMRQVDLPLKPSEWEYLVKFGTNLVFHKIDWMTGEISTRMCDHNGVVQEFKGLSNCQKLSKPREFGVS